jgi:serine phosphatase RsbU (regulator of sigma subunit)
LHNSVKLILQERRNRNIKVAESEFRRLEALSNLVVAKIELIDQVFEMREYDNGLAVTAEYLGRLKKSGFQKLEVFQDCGVVDIPYHIVSGDFYWSGKKDAKTYVVLGDAVGHGSSAALVSTAFLTVVDGMFNAFPRNTLVDFAQRTHDYFRENIVEAISSDHISVDFTFVVYDADAHKLRVVAKRQKALLRLGGTWQELKADRNTERMEDLLMEFDFAPGDMVVLYSDGVPSLQTDAEGTKLNQKGVLQFLEDFDGLKASKLSQQFEKMALDYRERFGQVDDVTFIALQL